MFMLLGALPKDYYIKSIFRSGEQGIWLDPSDFSTLFQDAAGTTPVTAVGQPVGLALDKRLGSTTGINLHTPTTPMNATTYPATGTRSGLDITVSQGVSGYASVSLGMPTVVGKTYLIELIAPDVAGFWVLVSDNISSDSANRRTAISTAPESRINTRITFLFTASATVTYIHLNRGNSQVLPATFKDVSVREVLGNHAYQTTAASRPTLQQDSNGLYYLSFDGTDDGMATPSIDFTGTDKVTVWAGVRKLSDAAQGTLVELGASASNNGHFAIFAPIWAAYLDFTSRTRGTLLTSATASGIAAPTTSVLCADMSISDDRNILRVNGTQAAATATDLGTGNYGNYPLYIGRRGGTTLPFNGRIYQLIIRGAASNAGQIAAGEAWCNSKTRAF